jgi:tRNA G18 (ribose-2'-O)-methylase SpoU
VASDRRISTRNARFQVWEAMLSSRAKREREEEFLVQGVRPISQAVAQGWRINTLIYDDDRELSRWARGLLADTPRAERVAMSGPLLAELGEKDADAEPPELVAVAELPPDDPDRMRVRDDFVAVAFDRPSSPGNLGSVIRSADAFGACGVFVTGRGADVYDPRCVRATTGSLFAFPVVRQQSPREVTGWLRLGAANGAPGVTVVGLDEHGERPIYDVDMTGPTLLVVGNETRGLSNGWREACDTLASIPMRGSASSLNAANAATAVLYELSRQRAGAGKGTTQGS